MEPCAIVPLAHADHVAAATASVAGESLLARVVRSLLGVVEEKRVVVATLPAMAADARACLGAAGLGTAIAVPREPGSRSRVIQAGLEYLGVERDTPRSILVADHRYPLSPGEVADRVLRALLTGHDVVAPTLPVTDTVKTVDEQGSVLSTVDRSTLRTVQYPRGFTAAALWRLLSISPASTPDDVDEFDEALRSGLDIGTVAGDANAFRVELPRDAYLLDAVISCRHD
ncbi:IspD/TarI family cytidylyltransferase [Mycolicibacterium hodleri]|uniref:4-diphosphocytidyl-2C-methyl-D-erythritol kinase n=1 Tax=Mycolicibacterium hodleri TaxID=49897 RepID=A0A502E5U1_9MYCO|nr:2-C-methyl-D-erythritol 4-phosphate cytidylyltransferase [Mycolicibacterium hodleri]TPG33075.1 4-diphosphocytidyl-2C-methyl-D-erythritol kinase [Mycolicibacterium hodleri]